jgi:hypothetical protein
MEKLQNLQKFHVSHMKAYMKHMLKQLINVI